MGGFDGTNFLAIVEVYDPELNIWEKGVELTTGRSGHASAVIYKPSGMPAYMDCRETDEQEAKPNLERQLSRQASTALTAAPSECSRMHAVDGSRCNICNDSPGAIHTASIPSTRSDMPLPTPEPGRPFADPTGPPIRNSVISSTTNPSSSNEESSYPETFTNPAISAILAVDRSTSPSLNDKKRARVHSFNSNDAIPPKCPTPRDEHAGQQLDRDDPRNFRRIYTSGCSSSTQRFDESACSSGASRISSSPSGDGGIDQDPCSVPSSSSTQSFPPLSISATAAVANSSSACAIFKNHPSDQCSVKALKNNLQRRLRALVTGGRRDSQTTKAVLDSPNSPGSPQSTSSQDEDMDT